MDADQGAKAYMTLLSSDRELLRQWFTGWASKHVLSIQHADRLREWAQALVDDRRGQGPWRSRRERRLKRAAGLALKTIPRLGPKSPAGLSNDLTTNLAQNLASPSSSYAYADAEDVRRLQKGFAWDQVEQSRDELKDVVRHWGRLHGARQEEVKFAWSQAELTVTATVARSAITFSEEHFSPRRTTAWSAVPFAAFLACAAIGGLATPATFSSSVAVGGRAVALALGLARAYRIRKASGTADTLLLGAGMALSAFTMLYLICDAIFPDAIVQPNGLAMGRIGEAALLALSVGGTVGPIGLELNGVARGIAFLQLLFTLTVVTATVAWGWGHLMEKLTERPPARSDRS